MSDVAIRVEELCKKYRLGARQKGFNTLRETLATAVAAPFRKLRARSPGTNGHAANGNCIWALKDVSFEVKQGDVVGIIGRNGAGKSTLLKILTRITEPTSGYADIKGRVASLLEVGTGFHPELSGRDNILLNGAILGMKKAEIERKFDEIVAFSEIEKFIETPVKHYSSGMYLRLAFAVAAHLEPEILLVDEVLAVGDASFQRKCLGKMGDVARQGRTVLFVSHNLAAVEHLCDKGVVLQEGKLVFTATAVESISYYLRQVDKGADSGCSNVIDLRNSAGRPSQFQPLLERVELYTNDNKPLNGSVRMGDTLRAHLRFRLEKLTSNFDGSLAFDNLFGQRVLIANSGFEPNRPQGRWIGEQEFICEIPSLTLVPGEYKVKVALDIDSRPADNIEDAFRLTVVESDYYGTGRIPQKGMFFLKQSWRLT